MKRSRLFSLGILLAATIAALFPSVAAAQNNRVLGQIHIQGKTNLDKSSGVWADGQYVGFVKELKGDKKLLLLPGDHKIEIRHAGYESVTEDVNVEAGKKTTLTVHLVRDPRAQFPHGVTSEIKLQVTPDRAAVFVDGGYVGTPHDFVIAPGKHAIRIALAGYRDFTTEVDLRPGQKMTIKTDLVAGNQPGPAAGSH
jgi:PEGA domain